MTYQCFDEKRIEKSLLGFHKGLQRKMLGQTRRNQHTNQHVSGFGLEWCSGPFLGGVKIVNATKGVSFHGDPPLQKFNEKKSEKNICQDLKLDQKVP